MKARTILTIVLMTALAGNVVAATAAAAGQVNVNTASVQELQRLPRVGPALAQRIVEFRTANGPFKSPDELTRVKGIGEKSIVNLKPYVTVNGPTTLSEKVKSGQKAKAEPAPVDERTR
ncbi:MAG: competence protein ComEA helix-hairpin-helix repeat protein [Anaeromyxobacteraceae bacterium]|jgi:competence protein ComEA|nr:competence protein ComEA helix-hairpin-helix repeat protein [Anaeromyxobacteraceae bacterium]